MEGPFYNEQGNPLYPTKGHAGRSKTEGVTQEMSKTLVTQAQD